MPHHLHLTILVLLLSIFIKSVSETQISNSNICNTALLSCTVLLMITIYSCCYESVFT